MNTFRLCLDGLMAALFVASVACRFTQTAAHEWTGTALSLLVLVHLVLNRRWFVVLFRPGWHAGRVLRAAVNLTLCLAAAGLLLSGLFVSQEVFPWLGLRGGLFAKRLHLGCAFWCVLLTGLHLGLYGRRLFGLLPARLAACLRGTWPRRVGLVLWPMLALWGGYALWLRQIPQYLVFDSGFLFWPPGDSLARLCVDYSAMMALGALVGAGLERCLRQRRA